MSDETLTTGAYPVLRWYHERPRDIAVIEGNLSVTYATLAQNIVQAAAELASVGVGPRKLVGIECEARYVHLGNS